MECARRSYAKKMRFAGVLRALRLRYYTVVVFRDVVRGLSMCVCVCDAGSRSRASAANRDLAGNLLEIHIGYMAHST